MKFIIENAKSRAVPQIEGVVAEDVIMKYKSGEKKETCWVIEIKTLEELAKIQIESKHRFVIWFPGHSNVNSYGMITIYNGYLE